MQTNPTKEKFIDHRYLDEHPDHIFVFGDNLDRRGHGGAAALRGHANTYGFVTKKHPTNDPKDYYRPGEYKKVFKEELGKLIIEITANPTKLYLISRLGAGLADRFGIYEAVIQEGIRVLEMFPNVEFLYED